MKILISAAETSSDAHGAQLLRALKARFEEERKNNPDSNKSFEAFGMGGPALEAQGLRKVVDARELLAMGFQEILGRLPRIFRSLRRLAQAAERERPDIAVVLDYPDFHFLLARRLKALQIPVVYYIPPKIWAWRKGRIQALRENFSGVLSILPFEEEFYRKEGVPVKYVGNPLVDELPLDLKKAQAREILGLSSGQGQAPTLVLMPGSRPSEIKQHTTLMLDAAVEVASRLRRRHLMGESQKLKILLPIPFTASLVEMRERLKQWELKNQESFSQLLDIRVSQGDAHVCLIAADTGIIKSGTSTLEAGVLGCPHVIVYRPGRLTTWIYRNWIRYSGPVGLVNLVAGGLGQKKEDFLLREILLEEATPQAIAEEAVSLWIDPIKRERISEGLGNLRSRVLGSEDRRLEPSCAAAEEVFRLFNKNLKKTELPENSEFPQILSESPGFFRRLLMISFEGWVKLTVSAVWSTLTGIVRWLLKMGLLKPTRLPSRVISVGNIQAGGAGKTPLVAQIAREAHSRGLVAAILSRGYGSIWEVSGGVIAPVGQAVRPDARADEFEVLSGEVETQLCGDEAALLHGLAPDAFIGVGANRVKQFEVIVRQLGRNPDVVILDDGFQNYKIHKDVELVAVTSLKRNEAYFRDWGRALLSADLVLWTKGAARPWAWGKPMVKVGFRLPKAPDGKESLPLVLVTGLGDPGAAKEAMTRAGYRIVQHFCFPDHARYDRMMAWEIFSKIRASGLQLAMTGKDWVKWREFEIPQEDVLVFEPEVIFEEGREIWDQILWK